jgi:hypothetical protein
MEQPPSVAALPMRLGKQELVGLEPVELKKVMEEALNGAVEPGVGLKLP